MNCKPGELAVVIANDITVSGGFCGKTVRVTVLHTNQNAEPAWAYEGPKFFDAVTLRVGARLGWPASDARIECIPDAYLRPLRGDGITDSEVRELYAPKPRETAPTHRPVHAGYPEV